MQRLILAILLMTSGLALGGCAGVVVGAGAAGGVAVAQERTVGRAIDDSTIQFKINETLVRKDESLFRRVNLEVVEGRVILTGVVPKPDDRVEAARAAWSVAGVKEVENELQVSDKTSLTNLARDTWITSQLLFAITKDRDIASINYSVETINGVVYLIGIARTPEELKKVSGHARTINGVTKVVSHVKIGAET